ncbi:MAG TPA: septation protein SepH, partial [Ornithinibacter sp.]|nr:septation protein SepH [Ornithinibacter sp.]
MGQAYAGNPASLGVGCGIWLSGSGTVVLTTSTTGSPHMQDLRLIGVHEDGQHLLLANADGGRFRLPLDEALRAAARRDRPRLGQLQIEIEGGLRPRDVQALIRRGLSAEEVADRAGWTVEKVRRFEGPVLAEREYVAAKARQCAVGSRGNGPLTLADRVADRLKDRGVERDAVDWDSARDEEGTWQLSMTFSAGGRQRTATWRYEPLGGSVTATNDEARWLSEDATPGAIPTPHRAVLEGDLDVYDIDADGGLERAPREPTRPARGPHDPIDLMAAMREQSARGRKRRRSSPTHTPGADALRGDALPLEDLHLDPTFVPPPPPPVAVPADGDGPGVGAHDEMTAHGELAAEAEEFIVHDLPVDDADAAPAEAEHPMDDPEPTDDPASNA